MKQITWEWEQIDEFTSRVKVIGGWLVVHKRETMKGNIAMTSVIITDQHWEWHPCAPFVDPQIKKSQIAKDFQA